MHKQRHWQLDLLLHSNKTVKIPLKYCLPTQSKKKLPKGWVYVDTEVEAEVKAEVSDLSKYCRVHPLPSLDLPSPADTLTAPILARETCTWPAKLLKHNKYVCILSIAVTTKVDYASMITILGSYIAHDSGHNTYQGHVNDPEMF
jgi:hypothetical protein